MLILKLSREEAACLYGMFIHMAYTQRSRFEYQGDKRVESLQKKFDELKGIKDES